MRAYLTSIKGLWSAYLARALWLCLLALVLQACPGPEQPSGPATPCAFWCEG